MTVDIDAIAVEGNTEPFRFSRGEVEYEMATLLALDWREQREVLFGDDTERRLRLLLGDDQYERFAATPLSTARLVKLLDLWMEHQGMDPGKSLASSS